MTSYTEQDIALTFDGDIILESNGDIKVANSLDTYKSAANFVLRTDYGDYAADNNVGCNLGSFIGATNTPDVHAEMEYNITSTLQNEIFGQGSVVATVVPFDIDEALAIIEIAGIFLIDGEYTYVQGDRMNYAFPYIDGNPTPLVV